ncbi:MAG TPA: hypothetical protein VHP11_04135 [Tepidisphaeraceae bacterium]|nr:hypothetical protein [Tepidisphaeraceae bacterium]
MLLTKMLCVMHVVTLAFVSLPAVPVHGDEAAPKRPLPKTSSELFQEAAVWNVQTIIWACSGRRERSYVVPGQFSVDFAKAVNQLAGQFGIRTLLLRWQQGRA